MDTRAAAATGVRVPLSLHPPGNRRGFCCPGGLCAAARQFARNGCSQSLRAVLFAAFTLRSWGHENSFQSGLRNSPYIRARQHRCCECLARDCSAGFNEQLISRLGQTGGPAGRPSAPIRPAGKLAGFFLAAPCLSSRRNWRGFFFTQLLASFAPPESVWTISRAGVDHAG